MSYPRADSQATGWLGTACEEPPLGSFEQAFEIPSDAVARSSLLYDQGVRVLLASLKRRAFDDLPVVVDIDTSAIAP